MRKHLLLGHNTTHTHAKETAARPLLSAVLVYGHYDPVNKANSSWVQ